MRKNRVARRCLLTFSVAAMFAVTLKSQDQQQQQSATSVAEVAPTETPLPIPPAPVLKSADEVAHGSYVLGPDDQISIRVPDADEISDKPVRIDMSGNIRLPMVGRVKASGLSAEQLETQIAERLKQFLNDPDVSVSILEFRSQPVSVIGSVKNPGVVQLQGRKTLIEVLSMAGGLADDAGHKVKITRLLDQGRIPLKSAQNDPSGRFSVAEVATSDVMEAKTPEDNIVIKPNDVISIPRAEMVYVTGTVMHAGGFVLRERESLSVLQALSLAGGLDHGAAPQNARILRPQDGPTSRVEIPVDLKKILTSQANDVPLQKDDILFVPSSAPKRAALRAVEAAVQMGTGVVIYRR